MGKVNLGKVRGTQIYTGDKITGSSVNGTIFENTGIAKAYIGDLYLNTDTDKEESKGNVYECVEAGESTVAKWSYKGNIRGPKVGVVNDLNSTSAEDALSSYQGKVIWDTMKDLGVFAKNILISTGMVVGAILLKIDNVDTELILTVDGEEYRYTYNASGTAKTIAVNVPLNQSIGMTEYGGNLTKVTSSTASIYEYRLINQENSEFLHKELKLWEAVNEATENHEITGVIAEDEDETPVGYIYKYIDKLKRLMYPISHAKAIWFNKRENRTVHDEIQEIKTNMQCENFAIEGVTSGFKIYQNNCIYNPLTGSVHILMEFECDATGIEGTVARVPVNLRPSKSVCGIIHSVNGIPAANLYATINTNGEMRQGASNSITSGIFEFNYFV